MGVVLIAYVQNGGNGTTAAQEAKYPGHHSALLRSSAVIAAIRQEQARVICGELGSIAIGTIRDVMRDPAARNSDRLTAARLAFEAARFIGRAATPEAAARDKPVAEMTAAELDTLISETQRALQQVRTEARTIEHASNADTAGTSELATTV
jgi:hypothetical protein